MRSILLVFAFVIVLSAVFASAPSPVFADSEEDFVMEVFPHPTADVEFWDSWGAPRPGGRPHRGTDVMSPKGTPVFAVADGRVVLKKWHRLAGWYLGIEHEGGWESYYAHLNNDTPGTDDGEGGEETAFAPGIEVGDFVEAGQVIGYVGDSGNAEETRPHTHFSLRHDGESLNPYPFLEDVWTRQLEASLPIGVLFI